MKKDIENIFLICKSLLLKDKLTVDSFGGVGQKLAADGTL